MPSAGGQRGPDDDVVQVVASGRVERTATGDEGELGRPAVHEKVGREVRLGDRDGRLADPPVSRSARLEPMTSIGSPATSWPM